MMVFLDVIAPILMMFGLKGSSAANGFLIK